jgi:ABC-type polar amino acid transport system ATPase subunit
VIVVDQLAKRYQKGPFVLDNISFVVPTGTTAAVLGRSGVGKSTLLRCLSGLEPFDRGSIVVDGVGVAGGENPAPLRGRVGVVFQSLELFPHLTVLNNCVLAPTVVKGVDRGVAVARAHELLSLLDVHDLVDAHPTALSGGQRQRVAIVRALMMEPRVLLYDEPTSALDPGLKAEVGRTIRDVSERTGMTQIIVSHDPEWASKVCAMSFILDADGMQALAPSGL